VYGLVPESAASANSVIGTLISCLRASSFIILVLLFPSAMNVCFGILVIHLEANSPIMRLRLFKLKAVAIISPKHVGPKRVSSIALKISAPIARASCVYLGLTRLSIR